MSIWKEADLKLYLQLYQQVEAFFSKLHGSQTLEYREGQHTMALDVLECIRDKDILLIEAGVGIGKSWGYLIPLIYASQNKETFKGFIVSTSTLALQDQLLTEIHHVSEMLGIDIDVTIAKGKTNYICQKRLEEFLAQEGKKKLGRSIIKRIEAGEIDRSALNTIPEDIWEKINITYVNCSGCFSKRNCPYILQRKRWPQSTAIICNHDLLIEALRRDGVGKMFPIPSILAIDEAHLLEEKLRNAYQESISKRKIEGLIYNLYDEIGQPIERELEVFNAIDQLYRMISEEAKKEYQKRAKQDSETLNVRTSGFPCTKSIIAEITKLTKELTAIAKKVRIYRKANPRVLSKLKELNDIIEIFEDLASSDSKNIYWASFLPYTQEYIELQYVRKELDKEAAYLLSRANFGMVFTSATLTTGQDNYGHFMRALGMDKILGKSITQEKPQPPPYNYDQNALLYCATDIISPRNPNRKLYLESLTQRISELIRITNGKSLVLFTSKSDMQAVYARLRKEQFPFNLMIQEEGRSADTVKERFKQDVTSTLLATGSFWEGVDIKGESLQQVIIAKLPFPLVDPIHQYKASKYTDGGFSEVYLPEMLLKAKQGAGRPFRSHSDKGVVSILDSRVQKYLSVIIGNLPFTNITFKLGDVKKFAETNLSSGTYQAPKQKIKHKGKKEKYGIPR